MADWHCFALFVGNLCCLVHTLILLGLHASSHIMLWNQFISWPEAWCLPLLLPYTSALFFIVLLLESETSSWQLSPRHVSHSDCSRIDVRTPLFGMNSLLALPGPAHQSLLSPLRPNPLNRVPVTWDPNTCSKIIALPQPALFIEGIFSLSALYLTWSRAALHLRKGG